MDIEIGGKAYPSFTTVEAATEFLAADFNRAAAWQLLNDDAKARALVTASRLLSVLPFCEVPDLAAPPGVLMEVAAMYAADIAAKPAIASGSSLNGNIKSVKAGSAQVEFFDATESASLRPEVPDALMFLLRSADLLCEGAPFSVSDGPYVSGISGGCAAPGACADHPPYWWHC